MVFAGFAPQFAMAQTTFTGTFNFGSAADGNVNSFAYNGTPILNLSVSNITKNGVTTGSSGGNFRASNWALDNTPVGGVTGSVDLGKYFEFTLTAGPGFTFNLDSLNFGVGRSATGPRTFEWRSSVGTYPSPISTYSTLNASVTNAAGVLTTPDANAGYTGNTLALSGSSASFTNLGAITLRFYAYNSEAGGGTGGLQGPLGFAGSLTGQAGTAYTWSGGAGNWEVGQAGAFGQSFASGSTATATFQGAGGAVNVTGTVEVATMTVASAGYSFSGGTISLANAALTVDADSTISSGISGSAGLVKNGNASLTLAGANTFTGLANIAAGQVVIGADSALGNADNDVAISGTLATTASITLGAGRSLSGPATLNIANGTTLTVTGSSGLSALTLVNTGTIDLQNATTRGVGALAFNAPATLTGSGSISASSVTAAGLASGTATVAQPLAFTSAGTKNVVVPAGELAVQGAITGLGTSYLTKTGSGTLRIGNALATGGIQVGFTSSTPSDGGTVVLGQNGSAGTEQLRLNYGTLRAEAVGGVTTGAGLSIGGREGALAVLDGTEPITFNGQSSFFRGSNTSGELRVNVNNTTTLAGGFAATSGGGSATGITIGGTGTLILGGDGTALTERIALTDTVNLELGSTASLGGGVTVGANNVLAGVGTIGGTLAGAGSVQPGTSLGILAAGQLDPAAGLDFLLEFTGAAPDYANVAASVNDVVRVTGATPFVSSLTTANVVNMFLSVTSITDGNTFEGGFFTNTAGDFTSSVSGATINYFVLGDGQGSNATLDGQGYYSFANWKAATSADPALALSLGTIARTANFTGGPVNGQAMVVSAVPEPSTIGLAAAAAGLAIAALGRPGARFRRNRSV